MLLSFLVLFGSQLSVGCAATSGAPGSQASDVTSAPDSPAIQDDASSREVFRASSDDERRALVARFQAQNGAGWNISGFWNGGLYDVDGFRGFIRDIWNSDPIGSDVPLSNDEAASTALTFVDRNAELLGLAPGDVYAFQVDVKAPPSPNLTPYQNFRWFVTLTGALVQVGYEDFPSVAARIKMVVGIHNDGSVRSITQPGTVDYPQLHLSTAPGLAASDPGIVANVLGVPLAHYDQVGTRGYLSVYQKTDLGTVESLDLTSIDLTIFAQPSPTLDTLTFTLAYSVSVAKGGEAFEFVVDAGTGEVLSAPGKPIGIVQ
jgi:hypothetical protein